MRRSLAALVVCVLTLAGCGGTPKGVTPPGVQKITVCSGLTDRCQTVARSQLPKVTLKAAAGRIPDVSSYQGHPNWGAAKAAGIAGAVVKAGEYVQDPDFSYNWATLRALRVWHAAYWFVRNTGCAHEAQQIIDVIRANGGLDSGPVVLDMEVGEAAGYAPCLDDRIFAAFHRHTVIYTAPGTWPGGGHAGLPLWQATYGSGFTPFWTPVVAWQCTDGVYGCVTYVPGIGYGDVSINLGLTKLIANPIPSCCREGDRGQSIWLETHRLAVAGWLSHSGTFYSHHVALVVKAYQRQHHLSPATGTTGPRTWSAIRVTAYRSRKYHRKDRSHPL